MGVSGCGKSSVGARLADYFEAVFVEDDSLHPRANVRKMRLSTPLQDQDRWPWLDKVGQVLSEGSKDDRRVVVSCSALKRAYRDRLRELAGQPVNFVFLQGDRELLAARMAERRHEFMPLSLLDSQLATLELPHAEPDVVTIDINQPLEAIVGRAMTVLALRRQTTS
uniref:Gluconokinase n=1 Tax=Agrobacterium albertimagni TaxID=147266 RepID=A0A7C1NYL8_9HYPH